MKPTTKNTLTERDIISCLLRREECQVCMVERICDFKDEFVHDPRMDAKDTTERLLGLALDELRSLVNSDKVAIKEQKQSGKHIIRKRSRHPK